MTNEEHITHFDGKPVEDWDQQSGIKDPTEVSYRLGLSFEEGDQGVRWTDLFAAFLDDPASMQITGFVIGNWIVLSSGLDMNSAPIVEAMVSARDRLPNLRALFLGDIIQEESEISWIRQSDISPLFEAYPALETFCVRGADGLSLGKIKHERLNTLIIQSGGLGANVVRDIAGAQLPELEHLELWMGDENYGGNATVDDLAPILSGECFPRLKYLGLRNSQIADEIAAALVNAPVLEKIRILDLSLGVLTDKGAATLISNPAIGRLEMLDIHHHYCSKEMVEKLTKLGIEIDVSDRQEPDKSGDEIYRYVAVSE
jgi:hypothetical protein